MSPAVQIAKKFSGINQTLHMHLLSINQEPDIDETWYYNIAQQQ